MNPGPEASASISGESAFSVGRYLAATGGGVEAVLFYGSRLHGSRPDLHSALDLVVVVRDYRIFYRALRAAGLLRRPAWLHTGLSRVLPPNSISLHMGGGSTPAGPASQPIAKCLVINRKDFARALGPAAPDHFLLGRLVQRVELAWTRGPETSSWVEGLLRGAYEAALHSLAPFLDETFTAESLGQRMVRFSYAAELRPEARDRPDLVFEAQRSYFQVELTPMLEAQVDQGTLARSGDRYRLARPPSAAERRRRRRYFRRSNRRATARWFKHILTFDGWLPYIVRKVERRTGERVELTRLERQLPLIFLWPRVIRILRTRPAREDRSHEG